MTFANQLAESSDPFNWTPEKSQLFLDACREVATFHYNNNPVMKNFYDNRGFKPSDLKSLDQLNTLPSIGVTAMKYHLVLSRDEKHQSLKLTSSGTRGQKTQVWFDQESLDRVQSFLWQVWESENAVSKKETNYLMFIYNPEQAKDLGIAFSVKNQTQFAPPKKVVYAIEKNAQGEWEFNKARVLEQIKEFIAEGLPVRMSGIPSFLFEFLEFLDEDLTLPSSSFIFTGGGWKAAENKKVSKEFFRELVFKKLGIPADRVRDGYGMAEHSSPYMECKAHRFHIPHFNRIIIRDPKTMEALGPEEAGLIELISPFNTMMPNLSIVSTDIGKIDSDACPCGYNSPTFSLLGRGGLSKHKGCAITANDLVKRKHQ